MYANSLSTLQKRRIESFELVLEHDIDEQYQYTPGEIIRGCAIAKLKEPVRVKALTVQIRGEASVSWQEETGHMRKYSTHEVYLDVTETLVAALTNDSLALEEGVHEFPFYYELPSSLPSSFIGRYGSITYMLKASLQPERTFGMDALSCSEPFLILRQLDLSLQPTRLTPYECEAHKRVIPWPLVCFAGRLKLNLTLNRTGFAPGEDIHITADVHNGTLYTVTSLQAAVLMHSTFNAQNKSINASQTVNKKPDYEEIRRGEFRRWTDVRLTIPPYIPESGLEGSDIMGVSYQFAFLIEVEGNPHSSNSLRIHIPITIGTKGIPKHEGMPVTMKELAGGVNAGMVTTRMPMYKPKTKSSLRVKKRESKAIAEATRPNGEVAGTLKKHESYTFTGGDTTQADGDIGDVDTSMFETKTEREIQPYGGNNEMRENPLYGFEMEATNLGDPEEPLPLTEEPVAPSRKKRNSTKSTPFGTSCADIENGPELELDANDSPTAPPRKKKQGGEYKMSSEVDTNVQYVDPNKKTNLYDDDLVAELADMTTRF